MQNNCTPFASIRPRGSYSRHLVTTACAYQLEVNPSNQGVSLSKQMTTSYNKPVDPVISKQSQQAVCRTHVSDAVGFSGRVIPGALLSEGMNSAKKSSGDVSVDKDSWMSRGVSRECSRLHSRSRRSLFTPMRVAQGPADKTHLMRLRRTKGIGLLTMKRFCITDDWTHFQCTPPARRAMDRNYYIPGGC